MVSELLLCFLTIFYNETCSYAAHIGHMMLWMKLLLLFLSLLILLELSKELVSFHGPEVGTFYLIVQYLFDNIYFILANPKFFLLRAFINFFMERYYQCLCCGVQTALGK